MTPDIRWEIPVYLSGSRDAAENLAIEEFLLQFIPEKREVLFIYENDPAVIIGRFQNPWRECRTGLARRRGIPVRRRISGGGTVVHGPGNLNFSVISGRRIPRKEVNLDRIIRALVTLGVPAERNRRFDLVIQTRGASGPVTCKVSGSAFRQTARSSMHHGTLLVNADLVSVRELLLQPPRDIEAGGVRSTPSAVANLAEISPGLSAADVAAALSREWGAEPEFLSPEDFAGGCAESLIRLSSGEWTWEKTPPFLERFSGLPGLGDDYLEASVEHGRIVSVSLQDPSQTRTLTALLSGIPYCGPEVLSAAGDSSELHELILFLAARVDGDFLDPGAQPG